MQNWAHARRLLLGNFDGHKPLALDAPAQRACAQLLNGGDRQKAILPNGNACNVVLRHGRFMRHQRHTLCQRARPSSGHGNEVGHAQADRRQNPVQSRQAQASLVAKKVGDVRLLQA
jgi:hypothetical protein